MSDQAEGVRTFFGLPLDLKVDALLNAAVELEESLSRQGERRLGHPGEWLGDYNDSIARRLFGTYRLDDPYCQVGCWHPLADALGRFFVEPADAKTDMFARRVDIFAAVAKPAPCLMLVDGMELLFGDIGIRGIDGFITRNEAVWNRIRGVGYYKRCFLAAYGFARASDSERVSVEQTLRDRFTLAARAFVYRGEDWIGYGLGIELTGEPR